MDELGNILREAREAKGLTLAEVHAQLRISTKFLSALEDGDYTALPTPVHIRGYLRNYARFLELDPEPLLARYEVSRNRQHSPVVLQESQDITPDSPLPVRDDQPFFNPVNVDLRGGGVSTPDGGGSMMRWLIIAAFLLMLTLVAVRFVPRLLGGEDGIAPLTEALDGILNSDDADAEPEATLEPLPGSIPDPLEPVTSTNRNDPIQTVEVPIPTITPTRPNLPATMEVINLQVDILERTWLRITIDNEVQFEGIATRGDAFNYEALDNANIFTGNALGVLVTINGVEIGRLGDSRGAIADETWTTTSN